MEVLVLVVWAGWALSLSDGFNIDVTDPKIFNGSQEDFFGFQVLQYQSDSHKQILVSAPLTSNQSGAVYSCTVNTENCTQLNRQDSEDARFFGMSLAASSTSSPVLTSCSPSVTRDCDGNSYLSGICYNFNSKLQTTSKNNVGVQECTKASVNLVFLFDGSSSMRTDDFNLNKKFIWDIITQLQNSSFKFAAVQFSMDPRTVFTFKDYMEKTAKQKLDKEQHMKQLTNTHKAIDYVLVNHFNNEASGADPDATKALVIITDGAPTDFDTKDVIKRCEDQRILRFVIGVGNVNLNKLKVFASEPKDNNTFMIKDYKGLHGLLFNLQNKIYTIEGGVLNRKRTKELSQSGFSAVYNEETLILGAVGSNDWRGSLYEVLGSGTGAMEKEIWNPALDQDSYLGYSVVGGQRGGVSLLFSGAPRANHTGRVTFFIKRQETWSVQTSVTGEQVGSYFGASLCLLDVNVDGDADFLVIGAPQYYQAQPQSEGRMYVYRITDQMMLEEVQKVSENVLGQFAASVTSVADLNGDELQDVAVGAPLEDDGRGAVYIYLGNQSQGVRPKYSQRILARTISEELKQFGVAIDGSMDLNEDRLTDLVVGARGTVILLKARPVLSVSAQLFFSPPEIILETNDCLLKPETTPPTITLSTCFSMAQDTSTDLESSGLNMSVELSADSIRKWSRVFFQQTNKVSRILQMSVFLNSPYSCFNHTIYVQNCVKDAFSPVLIQLNFSQSEPQQSSSRAVLNTDSKTQVSAEIPFRRTCQNNRSCLSDLELDFNYMNSTLLVVDQAYFIINVTLLNKGDDSFNTTVVLHYPPGLSLSKFETIKASRRTVSSCGDPGDGVMGRTSCSISPPVYHEDTSATFQGMFRISRFYNWSDVVEMTLIASSNNNGNFSNGTVRKTLAVQFPVDVTVMLVPQKSVTYLSFSLKHRPPKSVVLHYVVSNLGLKGLPVSVNFTMPSQISQNFCLEQQIIAVSQVLNQFFLPHTTYSYFYKSLSEQNRTDCHIIQETNAATCPGQMSCVRVDCSSFDLDSGSSVQFELEAQLTFLNPQLYTGRWSFYEFGLEEKFSSSAQLNFNRSRYNQISSGPEDDGSRFHRVKVSVGVELVIPPDLKFLVGSGAVGGLVLLTIITILLVKSGFFHSKKIFFPLVEMERSRTQVRLTNMTEINC